MGGSKKRATLALAAGFVAAFPVSAVTAAYAGGDVDYSGPFSGDVDSGGAVTKYTTTRCDTDAYSVGISVTSFTSSSGRVMNFRPVSTSTWDYQAGSSWVAIAAGASDQMGLTSHCWRFAAAVSPGRDTNGTTAGDGTTSFDGDLKY